MQKVYVEAVLADNFAVNFLILLFACRLSSTAIRWRRCALAAVAGSIYGAAVYGTDGFSTSIIIKVVVSIAMCSIAFWRRGERHVWKNFIAFYIATFIFAGAIYAISLALGQPQTVGGALAVPPAVRAVLLGLAAGAGLIGLYTRMRQRALQREPHIKQLALRFGEKQTQVKAFIDTGNLLTEPLSGLPVIFLSRAAAEELLGGEYTAMLAGNGVMDTDKLRIIPCVTAAGQAVVYGMELDGVSLAEGGTSVQAIACIAQSAPAGGCGAVVGSILTDELKKGAYHEESDCTKDCGLGAAAAEAGRKHGLHQRKRGASAATVGGGGGVAAGAPGKGGQIGPARAH